MLRRLETGIGIAAAFFLFLLMLVTLVDVTGRDLLNSPLYGATEITELLLAATSFLLYPIIAYREQHIAIDLIDSISGPVMRLLQKIVSSLIGAGLFGIIAWRMWILAGRALSYGDATASLRFPTAPVYFGMCLLSAVTALAFLSLLPKAVRHFNDRSLDIKSRELI